MEPHTNIYDPMPCLGGCGRMVKFPAVNCGSEGCKKRQAIAEAIDDKYCNMVDFSHD